MSRIRLALFPNRETAMAVCEQLLDAGILAEIHEELQLERFWFVSRAATGARLEVPLRQWRRAVSLIQEWDPDIGGLRCAIHCPECHSLRVDYPQFTRKSFLTNLAIGLMAELRLVEREYYCEDCHCMWSRQESPRRKPRTHLAPNYFIEGLEDS